MVSRYNLYFILLCMLQLEITDRIQARGQDGGGGGAWQPLVRAQPDARAGIGTGLLRRRRGRPRLLPRRQV